MDTYPTFDTLVGREVYLSPFKEIFITPEYLGWLQDKAVTKFSNQRFKVHTQASCYEYLNSFRGTTNIFVAIHLLETNQLVGTMTAYCQLQHGTADLGIMIGNRSLWGKGFGLDAWETLMDYLFKTGEFRKITGGTLRCNKGMISIMERSGMKLEATRPQQQIVDGQAQDELYYAKFSK